MAVTVNDIYNRVSFLLNKNQTSNTLNQEEFNNSLQWANLEFFKRRYGLPEDYRPGQPLPRMSYEETQLIIDALSQFKINRGGRDYPVLLIDVNGYATIPTDYIHYSSISYGKQPVEMLRDAQYQDRLNDSIKYPTKKDPICTIYSGYIQFQPTDMGAVNFVYLRLPATPYWAVTIVNDAYVYDAAKSIQFEYNDIDLTDIASMIAGYASTNIRDQFAKAVTEKRTETGI